MKKIIISMLLTAAAAVGVFGQQAEFRWEDAMCEYVGTYDTKRYSRHQIEDTIKLSQLSGTIPLSYSATVWEYEDIEALDPTVLDREYEEKRAMLEGLKVAGPYWEEFRKEKLKELEEYYQLASVTMRAYKNPTVLREFKGAEECKTKFAEPIIAGGERLADAWLAVNMESREKNSDPARLKQIFDRQNASPDRLKFALVETMAFGWWNCANATINYDRMEDHEERDREIRKLFVRIRETCEEP